MNDNNGASKLKILVIEDELSLRKDIVEMLTFEGFDVLEAENGAVGVRVARTSLPDLIICDIMMPELNGYQVLEALRKNQETQTIPFVFLTARTDKQDRRKGMDEGADDFLTKPFNVEDLLNTIHVRLEKHRQIITKGGQQIGRSIILSMPHELRTPLTVILGFSDIMMTDYQTMEPPRIYDMADHINKAALRLYHLVENYLVFAQIEIAAADSEFMNTLRTGTIEHVHLFMQAELEEKAKQHQRETDLRQDVGEIPRMQIREDLLKKLIEELADNAFKFSSPGTPVHVSAKVQDNQLHIEFTDQGRGMTAKQISLIGAYMQFDRKFHEQQGSGLGLVIAQRIAELYGGKLTVESQPNQGTTVRVQLPL